MSIPNKNYVYWIGVIPTDDRVSKRFKYGDYEWMKYSKYTWEHFCKRTGSTFIHYDKPSDPDMMRNKINWQRWLDIFKYIPDDWESIMLVDASIMTKWDSPNYFSISPEDFGAIRANENWGWTYKSATGYADMFPDVEFSHKDYFCSGMVVLRRKHLQMILDFQQFFYDNQDELLLREDATVLRGRDQPILNYFIQKFKHKVHFWDITEAVSHLYRREILGSNWQLKTDPVPFFIKYFSSWQFSGFPDRGDTRTKLMSQTWDIIKSNYE